jgi:hypothetical protein
MNIALSAVIIFILLIPPLAFYLSYSFGRMPKAGPKFTLPDGILASAIISLFVHCVSIVLLKQQIRFDIFLKIMSGDVKDVEREVPNGLFAHYMKQFAIYNIVLLVLFVAAGRVARSLVKASGYNMPQREFFRLNNHWWYLFNGKNMNVGKYDTVFIDALVETKEGPVIYSGFLIDFICEGEKLDRIYLGDAYRKKLGFPNSDANAQQIDGDIFSLSYDKIVNLNLSFVDLSMMDIQPDPELEEANME